MRPLARLSAAPALALALSACGPAPPPPNLLLVVIDTARADRLTPYGYARDTTPQLARFAAGAIRFERAYSTSSWTVPAHASLFTGLLPMTHQATQENAWLDARFETLAERLAGAGWQTAAFSNNAWVGPQTNLLQGFEERPPLWNLAGAEGARATRKAVRDWLAVRDPSRPFFLFVNLIDPHWRYDAPRKFQDRFVDPAVPESRRLAANFGTVDWYLSDVPDRHGLLERMALRSDLYDAEIAWADDTLGAILAALREAGSEDDTLVVVTSDHGELFGEHGQLGHSFSLLDPLLRVALLVRPPGGVEAGAVRDDPAQLPDVYTTLATAAGLAPGDRRVIGRDLLSGPAPTDRPLVAEYYRPDQFLGYFPPGHEAQLAPFVRRLRSVQVGDDKLVWGSDGSRSLVSLRDDPAEEHDLRAREPARAEALERLLDATVARYASPEPPTPPPAGAPDAQTRERLRDLGYVQ